MTYLTKEDWTNYLVPKISDDKSFFGHLKENIKIQNIFIRLIYKILNVQKSTQNLLFQKILISSMIYFHKYILFTNITYSDLSSLDRLIIYCSCIFLAFKGANKLIHINFFAEKFQPFFNKIKKYEIEEIKDLIIKKEFDILLSIEFNVDIDWPYNILNTLKIYLKKIGKGNESIARVINYVNLNINDSILFPLCLYYTPNEIVFSCILLAKERYKLDYININDLIKLNQYQIDNDNINECTLYISKIIKYKNDIIESNRNIVDKTNITTENNNNIYLDKNNNNDNLNLKNISLIKTNNN